jgi:hypothetical protein
VLIWVFESSDRFAVTSGVCTRLSTSDNKFDECDVDDCSD